MGCCAFQKFLMSSDSLHVYEASKLIFTSDKTGLLPLLGYINRFSPFHQRVTIIDKITFKLLLANKIVDHINMNTIHLLNINFFQYPE